MKQNSPYTAAITGGGFLFNETNALLPLLMSEDADALIKDEVLNNQVMHINAETSRKKAVLEIKRRYATMPRGFWEKYLTKSPEDQKLALFYVILKTYRILFDLHFNVTVPHWNSASTTVELADLTMEFNEISSRDEFVDSWSDQTKKKIGSTYLSILRHVGIMDRDNNLQAIADADFSDYFSMGETWFLEACLLRQYQIESLKNQLL